MSLAAAMADDPPGWIVRVAQWNMAGVNDEIFEFRQQEVAEDGLRLAKSFAEDLSREVEVLLQSSGSSSSCAGSRFQAEELHGLGALSQEAHLVPLLKKLPSDGVSDKLVQALTSQADRQKTVVEIFKEVRCGNRDMGRANLMFAKRTWGFIKLKQAACTEFVQFLQRGDAPLFLERLLMSIEREYPAAIDRVDLILLLLTLEMFLYRVSVLLLQEAFKDGKQRISAEALASSLESLAASMCIEEVHKRQRVAACINGVMHRYLPDAWCLQEFNAEWSQRDVEFRGFWDSLLLEYDCLRPLAVKKPHQVTHLLIRKAGPLILDKDLTAEAIQLLSSPEFEDQLRLTLQDVFSDETSKKAKGEQGTKPLSESQLSNTLGADGCLKQKVAMAVCRIRDMECSPVLVVAGHAKSDGTDNRSLVMALKLIASSKSWSLLAGLDANSAASFTQQEMTIKGAATQEIFVDFLERQELQNCWGSRKPDDVSSGETQRESMVALSEALRDPLKFHTVRKCRGFLQCQLHKANKPDQSAKDYVVSWSPDNAVTFSRASRVNKLSWLHAATDVGVLPDERQSWDGDIDMPNTEFVSDHALVLTDVQVACSDSKMVG